jgi:AraC-like DNA-binding protein
MPGMRLPDSERLILPVILGKREVSLRAQPLAPASVLRIGHEVWATGSRASRAAPHAALIHVRRGAMRIEHGGRSWLCGPGSLAILPASRRRTLTVLKRMECMIVNATGALLDAQLRALAPEVIAVMPLAAAEAAWFDALIGTAAAHHAEAPAAAAQALLGLLAVLRLRAVEPAPLAAGERVVRRALALLAADGSAATDAGELARRVGVHRDHLSRCFRWHAEVGLGEHLRRRRLDQALRLLAGGMACARAAQQCGYADGFAFSKAFRRRFGHPPSAWREVVTP